MSVHSKLPMTLGVSGASVYEESRMQSSANSSLAGDIILGDAVKQQCLHAEINCRQPPKAVGGYFSPGQTHSAPSGILQDLGGDLGR